MVHRPQIVHSAKGLRRMLYMLPLMSATPRPGHMVLFWTIYAFFTTLPLEWAKVLLNLKANLLPHMTFSLLSLPTTMAPSPLTANSLSIIVLTYA
jgi:hypothetical protein